MILSGGRFRGRHLKSPIGDVVRPTPARVKEALFSILAPRLADAVVLDLYAGTGALGLEALSRGAAHASFVEANARIAKNLKNTTAVFGLESAEVLVFPISVEACVRRLPHVYDLVFADPPYIYPPPLALFKALHEAQKLQPHALLIYEHAAKVENFDPTPFRLVRREAWGEVGMSFLELP